MSLASKMKQEPHLVSHKRLSKEVSLRKESNTAKTPLFLLPQLKTKDTGTSSSKGRKAEKQERCVLVQAGAGNVLRRSQQTGTGHIGV